MATRTEGAGGGSIAWIDRGGALRVGPQSAGADPGPACYGRGGELPTVTDAHTVLGHLQPDTPLGGLERLYEDRARDAVEPLASQLGLSIEATALGILEVADASMERAIRVVSVERGHDPRDYALLAFGGAGPLHGVSIARRLSMSRVLVPAVAGVLSAYGLLVAETGHDNGQSVIEPLRNVGGQRLSALFQRLAERGRTTLIEEGIDPGAVSYRATLDLRYMGQSHELHVPVCTGAALSVDSEGIDRVAETFHAVHRERFGHAAPEEAIELVTARVRALAPTMSVDLSGGVEDAGDPVLREAEIWFDPSGPMSALVIDRRRMSAGSERIGPAILVGADSTTVVPPGVRIRKDAYGTILLEGLE